MGALRMTALAPPDIAQQLQANLQAQRDCAQKLLGLMQEERRALMASDVERLETLTQTKSEAATLLQQLGAALLQLRMTARAPSFDSWFVTLRNGLPALWDELLELRSEEHTSELQSLMRISYAVFCLKKKTKTATITKHLNSSKY